jgi:hypothetical protein
VIRWNGFEIDRQNLTIRRGDKIIRFVRRYGRSIRFDLICHVMLGPPQTQQEIFDKLYSHDPDGGPISRHSVFCHIHVICKKMAPLGIAIKHGRGHYPRTLRLEVTETGG